MIKHRCEDLKIIFITIVRYGILHHLLLVATRHLSSFGSSHDMLEETIAAEYGVKVRSKLRIFRPKNNDVARTSAFAVCKPNLLEVGPDVGNQRVSRLVNRDFPRCRKSGSSLPTAFIRQQRFR